jgi:hypothetical protein
VFNLPGAGGALERTFKLHELPHPTRSFTANPMQPPWHLSPAAISSHWFCARCWKAR